MKKILLIFGTRPEAIKMAPVIKALQTTPTFNVKVCVTAQHRQMLDQVLNLFEIVPDIDLNLMKPGQDLTDITIEVLRQLREVLQQNKPDWVVVQGDTTTAFATALAAFYQKIPVAHVEAGLRTFHRYSPWPEEMNRSLTAGLSSFHFAPTEKAKQNLLQEGIDEESIRVTGNTVIDALLQTLKQIDNNDSIKDQFSKQFDFLHSNRHLILVTGHRRENFGKKFEQVCSALKQFEHRDDVEIVYPVHLNPNVQQPVKKILRNISNIFLIEPLDYLPFVYLMNRAHIILTDSGGIQEEAPSLGKPVLVTRETTERPEAVEAGTVVLVGTNPDYIVDYINQLIYEPEVYRMMSQSNNPYGDGQAAQKILEAFLNL